MLNEATFQCDSTVKVNLLKNTGMLAEDAFADILETIRRWTFTASLKSRSARHDFPAKQ